MAHKLSVRDGKLVVEFSGLESFEAIKKRLEFSLGSIVSVSTETRRWLEGIRVGGTGLPGVIKEGRYILKDGRAFFAMRRPDKSITIEFRDEQYKYLIVEVDDKKKAADRIMQARKKCSVGLPASKVK